MQGFAPTLVQDMRKVFDDKDDGVMPDVLIVTYELAKMAMSFDCTVFTVKYMSKTSMSIRQSACVEHLAILSYRLAGAKLAFDGRTETFVDNDEANKRLKPSYRKHYRVADEV